MQGFLIEMKTSEYELKRFKIPVKKTMNMPKYHIEPQERGSRLTFFKVGREVPSNPKYIEEMEKYLRTYFKREDPSSKLLTIKLI